MQAQKEAAKVEAATNSAPSKTAAAPAKPAASAVPSTPPPVVKPPAPPQPAPPAFAFARPLDLGRQLVRSLTTGDFAAAGKLAAASDADQSASAAKLFQQLAAMGYKPAAEDQVELLGLVENRTRIALPFMMPGSKDTVRIQLDLERDEKMGWKVTKATLPKARPSSRARLCRKKLTVPPSRNRRRRSRRSCARPAE